MNERLNGTTDIEGTGTRNLCFQYAGTTTSDRVCTLYLDGILDYDSQIWNPGGDPTGNNQWVSGYGAGGGAFSWSGGIEMLAFWNTPQPLSVCKSLSEDPYQLFELA